MISIKRRIAPYLRNVRGWRSDRKIVVIESDDWGSIRMPSPGAYHECLKAGYRVDEIAYEKYDSLASTEDLDFLFDLLSSHRDCAGDKAVITGNILPANPDFSKIEGSAFEKYFFEKIEDTFERYPNHAGCLTRWREGIKDGVFYPQSHGREHLNVSLWMDALRAGDRDVHFGFRHHMPGSMPKGNYSRGNKYVVALHYHDSDDKKEKCNIVAEGLTLFEELFGFQSESFTPPNYIWSPDFDPAMSERGVQFYQGSRIMREPVNDHDFQRHYRYTGQQNEQEQVYLTRNAFFEPALHTNKQNVVDRCLYDINAAFRMKKPAIICSHRLNYVGYLQPKNRDENLKLLDELLTCMKKKWPGIEFMTSVQLGHLMKEDLN